jgi:hypothetical protein
LAARVTVTSLNLAVRADLGAQRSLARLTRLTSACRHEESAGPWRRYLRVYHLDLDQNRALFLANRNWPCGQGGMIPLVLG